MKKSRNKDKMAPRQSRRKSKGTGSNGSFVVIAAGVLAGVSVVMTRQWWSPWVAIFFYKGHGVLKSVQEPTDKKVLPITGQGSGHFDGVGALTDLQLSELVFVQNSTISHLEGVVAALNRALPAEPNAPAVVAIPRPLPMTLPPPLPLSPSPRASLVSEVLSSKVRSSLVRVAHGINLMPLNHGAHADQASVVKREPHGTQNCSCHLMAPQVYSPIVSQTLFCPRGNSNSFVMSAC